MVDVGSPEGGCCAVEKQIDRINLPVWEKRDRTRLAAAAEMILRNQGMMCGLVPSGFDRFSAI